MDCFTILMEHAVTVYGPPTTSRDTGGGTVLTWSTVRQSGVACLINAPMASDQERFSQTQLIGPVTFAMFYDGAQRGDKLTVTAGPSYVGVSVHVIGIKRQPGVDAIGFDEVFHVTGEVVE